MWFFMMLKMLLHINIICLSVSACFINASADTNASAKKPLAAVDTFAEEKSFDEISLFYTEKLNRAGINASVQQINEIFDKIKRNCVAQGSSLADLKAEWLRFMELDIKNGYSSQLFFYLLNAFMRFYPPKASAALSSENVFKSELRRYIEKQQWITPGFQEEFYAYAWEKLVSQYDSAEFKKLLDAEAQNLTSQTAVRNYPLFCHLTKIYKALSLLCLQIVAEGPVHLGRVSQYSEALGFLKKVEQKNPQLAQSQMYDKSPRPDNHGNSHDMILFRRAFLYEIWAACEDRWLKDFASELELDDKKSSEKITMPQLRNRARHELVRQRGEQINVKIFDKVCDQLFHIFGNNEQELNHKLTEEIKASNYVKLLIKEMNEKNNEVLRKSLIAEKIIEEVTNADGTVSFYIAMQRAPFVNGMLKLYDTLNVFFETLKKKKIVYDEEIFFSMVHCFERTGLALVNYNSGQANDNTMKNLLEFFEIICSENMAMKVEQIRKNSIAKKQNTVDIDRMVKQAEDVTQLIWEEEKAASRQIARKKSREEKNLLQQACLTDKEQQIEKNQILQVNGRYVELVTKAREMRQGRPDLEEQESLLDDIDDTELRTANSFIEHIGDQKITLKEVKALRRKKLKEDIDNWSSIKEKNPIYDVRLLAFVSELKKMCSEYDQQETLNLERLAYERKKACQHENEKKAQEYEERNLKKSFLQKVQSFVVKKQSNLEKMLKEETMKADFLKTYGKKHNPYEPSVLGNVAHDPSRFQMFFPDSQYGGSTEVPVVIKRHNPYAWSVKGAQ